MKNLRYVGGDDIRELSPSDLQQLGVDADYTLTFRKGTSTTVEDSVADAILGSGLVQNVRETTEEELAQEERDLEASLGFAPYDPNDHTVAEVSETLATSSESKRQYILDQERAGQNRKGVFSAVGAEWEEQPAEAADSSDLDFVDEATTEAMAEAGGQVQASSGSTGGGVAGPANTSPDA